MGLTVSCILFTEDALLIADKEMQIIFFSLNVTNYSFILHGALPDYVCDVAPDLFPVLPQRKAKRSFWSILFAFSEGLLLGLVLICGMSP